MAKTFSRVGSKDMLDDLFGSKIRVKVLKFLFRNSPADFTVEDLSSRIQENHRAIKKEIEALSKLRLIRKK